MSLTPYYDDGNGIVIYHGDCREILPELGKFDLLLTDPPYPNYMEQEYKYRTDILEQFRNWECEQAIFWTPSAPFPLDYCGLHAWDKATGTNTQFELIYQRVRGTGYKIHRYMTPHNRVRAQICGDRCNTHMSQKPLQLLRRLFEEYPHARTIIDPFAGSCTTAVAAKLEGRKATCIEINEKYCEIGANRLRQSVFEFSDECELAEASK
jgi:DNA modification methylase